MRRLAAALVVLASSALRQPLRRIAATQKGMNSLAITATTGPGAQKGGVSKVRGGMHAGASLRGSRFVAGAAPK